MNLPPPPQEVRSHRVVWSPHRAKYFLYHLSSYAKVNSAIYLISIFLLLGLRYSLTDLVGTLVHLPEIYLDWLIAFLYRANLPVLGAGHIFLDP